MLFHASQMPVYLILFEYSDINSLKKRKSVIIYENSYLFDRLAVIRLFMFEKSSTFSREQRKNCIVSRMIYPDVNGGFIFSECI